MASQSGVLRSSSDGFPWDTQCAPGGQKSMRALPETSGSFSGICRLYSFLHNDCLAQQSPQPPGGGLAQSLYATPPSHPPPPRPP